MPDTEKEIEELHGVVRDIERQLYDVEAACERLTQHVDNLEPDGTAAEVFANLLHSALDYAELRATPAHAELLRLLKDGIASGSRV